MPVLAGDSQEAWDQGLLEDPRNIQLWDADQLFGTWLQANHGAFWDAFLFYGPDAHWDTQPTAPLATGSTIIGSTRSLSQAAERLLTQ